MAISRRTLLKSGVGVGVLGAAGITLNEVIKTNTNAKIVIAGGGAAGITIANKLSHQLKGAEIYVIEPRDHHWYQPGQTLLLAGSYTDTDKVMSPNQQYISDEINWINDTVTAFNPDNNQLETLSGQSLSYDYLVIATGVELRFDMIEGLDTTQIGHDGIASIYYSPSSGLQSHSQAQNFVKNKSNGKAVFTRPSGAMKCAGAPMKATNLVEYFARMSGKRDDFSFSYFTAEDALFSVVPFNQKLDEIWSHRAITPNYKQTLVGVDSANKTAIFELENGSTRKEEWDFIHIAPPMSAPKVLRESSLANDDKFKGYLDVDPYTLQHNKYSNVFGIGDCVGTPIGKTAASVKAQSPVVASNLIRVIQGFEPKAKWDGYTSCPMILDVGHAMLWEFDYSMQPVTALPFEVVDPLDKSTLSWYMEEQLLRPIYDLMLNGYTPI